MDCHLAEPEKNGVGPRPNLSLSVLSFQELGETRNTEQRKQSEVVAAGEI